MSERLYVIGNGFDLSHKISSNYFDFADYLERVDRVTFRKVEKYLLPENDSTFDDEDDLKKNLSFGPHSEEALANLKTELLLEEASSNLVGYSSEEWSDDYHHNYQFEIEQVVLALSIRLRAIFAKWIRQLQIPDKESYDGNKFLIKNNSSFLNFNYTSTLVRKCPKLS